MDDFHKLNIMLMLGDDHMGFLRKLNNVFNYSINVGTRNEIHPSEEGRRNLCRALSSEIDESK